MRLRAAVGAQHFFEQQCERESNAVDIVIAEQNDALTIDQWRGKIRSTASRIQVERSGSARGRESRIKNARTSSAQVKFPAPEA